MVGVKARGPNRLQVRLPVSGRLPDHWDYYATIPNHANMRGNPRDNPHPLAALILP